MPKIRQAESTINNKKYRKSKPTCGTLNKVKITVVCELDLPELQRAPPPALVPFSGSRPKLQASRPHSGLRQAVEPSPRCQFVACQSGRVGGILGGSSAPVRASRGTPPVARPPRNRRAASRISIPGPVQHRSFSPNPNPRNSILQTRQLDNLETSTPRQRAIGTPTA